MAGKYFIMDINKNIRIKDIAKLAGVSVGTVDRVIHQRGKVSEDAQKKVEEILSQTGYKPNLLARTLGSNKQVRIVALQPDPNQDEYWSLSEAGVQQAVQEWDQYGVEIIPAHFGLYGGSQFSELASEILKNAPDGLLIAPIYYKESQKLFKGLKEANIPFVLFNTNITETSSMCFIGQDLYQSGMVAGELLDRTPTGKKKIAVLHVHVEIENAVHLKAKENGLKDYFTKISDNHYEIISPDFSNPDPEVSEAQFKQLLADEELHGLLVTTSRGTHITAAALEKFGRTDVHLVGYDLLRPNVEYLQKGTINYLINQNPKRQAMLGVSYLANNILFQKEPPHEDLFPLEIITRQNLDSYLRSKIH